MLSSPVINDSSLVQGSLWGRRARDWSEVQEAQSRALYDVMLKALSLTKDTALLDAGCGSGLFCALASQKGAAVMGLDVSSGMLDFARKRAPHTTFLQGEMEVMPFVDQTFEVVTAINSLHHTNNPLRVLAEARRVLRPGGRVAIASWARSELCHVAGYFRALDLLLPVASPHTPAAFSFSNEGAMAKLITRAGFAKLLEAQALTIWEYPDEATALRGLLSTSAAVRAIDCAGEERVIETAKKFLAPHRLPRGGYRMENAFRYLIAQRT